MLKKIAVFLFIWIALIAVQKTGFSQFIGRNTPSIYGDTIYRDTTINGKQYVIQQIILYDTLKKTNLLSARHSPLLYTSSPKIGLDIPKLLPLIAPQIKKHEMELGFCYQQGYSPVIDNRFTKFYEANRTINDLNIYYNFTTPYKYWYAKSGVGLRYSREHTWFNLPIEQIDSSFTYFPYTFDSTFIDTAYFLDVNQLPDTVYIMHIDTFSFTVYDTLIETLCDTIKTLKEFDQINRYFYIEVPLLIGYNLPFKNIDIGLETGLYFGWLAKVNGKTIDKTHSIRQLNENYHHRITIDAAFRIRFKYYLTNRNAFTLTPDFRYSLYNLYRNNNFIAKKIFRWGLAFGYIFN